MARQRRGGGFRPPELRGTLGTLLRTTLAQAGTLRDALERGAREGRSRLDSALSNRRRQDALAELGEIVLDLIRRGEIDLAELPEIQDIVAHLDEIDAGHDEDDDEEVAAPTTRNRFDTRAASGSSRSSSRTAPSPRATWSRPSSSRGRATDDDGTVSSRTWSRPSPAKPAPRVWRPPVDDEPAPAAPDDERPEDEAAAAPAPGPARRGPAGRKDPTRKGGIHFDDDEDLAEYMHPDDVPPKTPPDGDS